MTTSPKPWCCPRWTTPNGTCSDDDSGAGQHTCRATTATHAKCRCACGVETPRPMGLREVARYEERQRQVSINVGPGGVGSIVVGGVDIANMVTSATVELRGMQPTRVTLGMGAVHVVAETRGELDEQTAKALEALGWSGPDTELLRRRDLQEALGGLGTVLRDWDDLMEWVRLLVTHNGELAKEISSLSESDAVLAKVADALANNAPSEVKWSTVIERIGEMRDEIHELKTSEE